MPCCFRKIITSLFLLRNFSKFGVFYTLLSRCMFINNCKSSATWQVVAISDQSFADGKWHRFGMHVTQEMEHSVIQCQVDGSSSTNTKINGTLTSDNDEMLFLAGLPVSSQIPRLNGNSTCFPEVVNFSGCIADLQINLVSSPGPVRRLNTSHAKQFGDVLASCTQAKDSIVSFADKNSKILLVMRDNIRINTSCEFQIRTLESRAFIGKIMNEIVTALFFLEAGKMKVSARFKDINGQKGEFFHITSSGISLSDNHWHKVSFNVAVATGANLLINDELKAQYKIREKLVTTNLKDAHEREAHVTLRFGRSARRYPSFIGCFRDVYVNNYLVNFSLHHSSKGISVGKCANSFSNDWPRFEENNSRNTSHLRSTADTPVKDKTVDGLTYKTTKTPAISNTTGNILLTATPNVNKTYSVAVALAVGLLIIVIVTAYIIRTCLKSRLQNCCIKQATEENADTELNNTAEVSGKEMQSFQPAECLRNAHITGRDQQSSINLNLHASIPNGVSGIHSADNYRSAMARKLDQSPVKVWEERFLSHASVKAAKSNFLTVPTSCYNNMHIHKTSTARSQENLPVDIDNIRPTIIPSLDESINLPKHGFHTELSNSTGDCCSGGRRTAPDANLQSPKRLNKVYSGHDSLPKPKKVSGLSWAYGTRFNRHESSDTDCSDVTDRVTRTRPRNQMMESGRVAAVKPWQLKFLESSEDEQENHRRASSVNHLHGKHRRLRTFTEDTYKLYSLREEEREIELDPRRPFTANRLKVYCKDTYSIRGRNRSTSFAEAAVLSEDTAGIGAQVRSLDGYTSSCPESIHCLSEKEDTALNTRRSKRLTTYYF